MIMYMTTKKQQSHKNKSRFNKKQQQQKKQKLFIGGTCAMCGSCMNQSPLFRGGKNCTWKRRRGGNDNLPSFTGLPLRYFYPENTLNNDPNNPSAMVASRQLSPMIGGKNRTKKATKRGGALGFSLFNGQMGTDVAFNPLNTVGDTVTSQLGSNYISGDVNQSVLPNPSVFSQPVESKYNMYNMPLA
jgi:hypothetical protein